MNTKLAAAALLMASLAASTILAQGPIPRPAPSLEFTSLQGEKVSLADLKGKPVLIMFFSTVCPHCQNTAEAIAPIYNELKSQGVEVLGLALDADGKKNLSSFVSNHAVRFPIATSTRMEFSRFTGISVMAQWYYPYLLFVDKNGVIRNETDGNNRAFFGQLDNNLYKTLKALLAEKPTS